MSTSTRAPVLTGTTFNGLPGYGSLQDALRACFQRWTNPSNRYRYAVILPNAARDTFYVVFGQTGGRSYASSLARDLNPSLSAGRFDGLRSTRSFWSRAEYARVYQVDPETEPPHLYCVQRGHAYSPDGFCLADQLVVPYEAPNA